MIFLELFSIYFVCLTLASFIMLFDKSLFYEDNSVFGKKWIILSTIFFWVVIIFFADKKIILEEITLLSQQLIK